VRKLLATGKKQLAFSEISTLSLAKGRDRYGRHTISGHSLAIR
jgi:hypothetical protein